MSLSLYLQLVWQFISTYKLTASFFAGGSIGGLVIALVESDNNARDIGLAIIGSGVITGVVLKLLDMLNDYLNRKREEKKAKKKEEEQHNSQVGATSVEMTRLDIEREKVTSAEARRMREEERAFYTAQLARADRRADAADYRLNIATLRVHAIGTENMRLQNVCFKILRAVSEGKPIPEVIIINDDLIKYLAELEGMPMPPEVVEKKE